KPSGNQGFSPDLKARRTISSRRIADGGWVMTGRDAAVAWRLFKLTWIPVTAMCGTFLLAVTTTSFSIEPIGFTACFAVIAVYLGFAYYNALAPHRRDPQIVFVLGSTAQLAVVVVIMGPLTY